MVNALYFNFQMVMVNYYYIKIISKYKLSPSSVDKPTSPKIDNCFSFIAHDKIVFIRDGIYSIEQIFTKTFWISNFI